MRAVFPLGFSSLLFIGKLNEIPHKHTLTGNSRFGTKCGASHFVELLPNALPPETLLRGIEISFEM
jgi:hypothetical protein